MQFSKEMVEEEVGRLEAAIDASPFDDVRSVSQETLRLIALQNLKKRHSIDNPTHESIFINDGGPCC